MPVAGVFGSLLSGLIIAKLRTANSGEDGQKHEVR